MVVTMVTMVVTMVVTIVARIITMVNMVVYMVTMVVNYYGNRHMMLSGHALPVPYLGVGVMKLL